jgi:hypothetical protein
VHFVRLFISRTKKVSDANGSLDILDVFAAVLCDGAVNSGTPVRIFNPGNAQNDSGEGGKAVLPYFLQKTLRRVKDETRA